MYMFIYAVMCRWKDAAHAVSVKSKIMHCFNNYVYYILYIIASNLLYSYIFQVSINLIKRRREDVETRVLHAWL